MSCASNTMGRADMVGSVSAFEARQIFKPTENIKREVKFPPMHPEVGHSVVAQNFRIDLRAQKDANSL